MILAETKVYKQKRDFSSHLIIVSTLIGSDAEEEGELEPAKELIRPIAEKLLAKYKAKEEETPLLFFVAGEVRYCFSDDVFWITVTQVTLSGLMTTDLSLRRKCVLQHFPGLKI